MRILAISDLHGDLESAWAAVEAARPDALLSCGDWGDPGEIELPDLERLSDRLPVYTVFGNHDNLDAVRAWKNRDGSSVLLEAGAVQALGPLTIAGISGIWAKSRRKPFYVTDEDVDEAALRAAAAGRPVDILLSHGCPSGVADLTWQDRRGGHRCFLRAFQALQPRVYLTGHLHRVQEYSTRAGQVVRNLGQTPRGDATLITGLAEDLKVDAFQFQ
jgi:uncharacterized protein